jgi:hypothetical protein
MSENPTMSQAITPTNPPPARGTNSSPNTMIPTVTTDSIARRPKRSASGPEIIVKMPKNTTPTISMMRNSGRV